MPNTTAVRTAQVGAASFFAGKNKIINGDFNINQRNFSSTTAGGTYGFDRWRMDGSGGTTTYSAQTFTAGTAPVAGYEARNFARLVTASQSAAGDYCTLIQPIEDVRTFANQTVTVSFWAKAASGTPKIGIETYQDFGTGGSPSAGVSTPAGTVTLSTSWARYTLSFTVPSISGKTIGTTANTSSLLLILWTSAGSTNATRASSIGIQNNTFDIWGVQVEAGSTATAFQTATGNIQGELAACQRYYVRFGSSDAYGAYAIGTASQTSTMDFVVNLPVTMRINPSSIDYSNLAASDGASALLTAGTFAIPASTNGNDKPFVRYTKAGATQFRPYFMVNNNGTGYIGFNAEL